MNNYRIAMRAAAFAVLMGSCQSIVAGGGGTILQTQVSAASAVMPNRIFRSSPGSTCGSVRAFPGTYSTPGAYAYQTLGVVKAVATGCVNFTIHVAGTCPGIHLTAYDGVFNPGDLAVGYLGDSGNSAVLGADATMGLDLALSQNVGLVVTDAVSGDVGPCAVTVSTLEYVTPRTFTVFVGQVPSGFPPFANHLAANGINSTCDVPKSPGIVYGGTYPYFKFVGTSPVAACARVTSSVAGSGCGGDGVHLAAYADAFDSNFLAMNYLGDTGNLAQVGLPRSMSVIVGPNEPIILIANQGYNTAVSPCTVSLSAFDLVNDQVFADSFGD